MKANTANMTTETTTITTKTVMEKVGDSRYRVTYMVSGGPFGGGHVTTLTGIVCLAHDARRSAWGWYAEGRVPKGVRDGRIFPHSRGERPNDGTRAVVLQAMKNEAERAHVMNVYDDF